MSRRGSKRSSDEIASAIQEQHQNVRDAAHTVLASAGLQGVKIHSVSYSVAPEAVSGSPCPTQCQDGETCTWVMGPNGGEWKCV
jgi:hypothetical protein